ncbi:DNA repair protein rad51 [Phlyctema vagabunda]|uniref:DNA repair protein rad51 n=1 Tax=Phlyctema vagabunda TaxID=108571 RepID=A0ABR4PXC1_9HELO
MSHIVPFFAYKETRLNLDAATSSSTVNIRLPIFGSSTWPSRTAQKRSYLPDTSPAEDEGAFRRKHLASAASIYHRIHHKSPRSFLWRVLEDGKVLSIRTVDVSRQPEAADANITLRFTFPHTIRPSCVAFADSSEHDVLSAFVLTEEKHIYTLNLRPDFFRKPSSTEGNVGDWCKIYFPPSFSFKFPHRVVALSADEILIALIDGGLMRLEKNSGHDGSTWKENFYSESSWGLKSLIPFQGNNTIQFGKLHLEQSTATSIASPSTLISDVPHAFTVCLDHKLRIWNLRSGKVVYCKDILDPELDPHDAGRPVISPSYSQLVRVLAFEDGRTLCVTFSPNGLGQFKFWDVATGEDGLLDVQDLFPESTLEPRAPTSDVWTLADFSVLQDRINVNGLSLWILWKNNTTYRIQKLAFQKYGSVALLRQAWQTGWEGMTQETVSDSPLPTIFHGDASDGTDKWLEFIFLPGRFTTPTIETCLAIYESGLGASKEVSGRRTGSLPERLCSKIACTANLVRKSDGQMDFEQFRVATDAQWRRFYRLLIEIKKQQGEALSLVVDPHGELPLVISADGISAIRSGSDLERIWHNQDSSLLSADENVLLSLISAAAALRDTFSEQLTYNFHTTVLRELFEDPSEIDPVRIRSFYDMCDFTNQIGDEEYTQLVTNLGGDFKNVTPQVYEALLSLMTASDEMEKRPHELPLADFGNKMVVKGVQEIVELHRNICLDQLALLVLIEAEINHGEEGIGFDTATIFRQLLTMLKQLELVGWLAKTQISLPLNMLDRSSSLSESMLSQKKPLPADETVTILEGVLRHLFGLDTRRYETLPSALTEILIQICDPDSEYEAQPVVIQCFLLKNDRPDLALDFSRFAGNDAFSTYIQGRVSLAANDAYGACSSFKKAAFGMAYPDPKQRTDHRSAGYLEETDKNLLNAGLPAYYSHIVALFDKVKAYSYVIDFARLALQFVRTSNDDQQNMAIRTEMHSRLFNAAIQTSRYGTAHSILALFTDNALQQSSLRTLVTKMCEASYASQLVEMPFVGMQDQVDDILAQKCQSIVELSVGVPYHKILYAWRIKRSDYRGAAAIALERLQRLQQSGDGDLVTGQDELETAITKQYVTLINALSCVDPKQAWILSEPFPQKPSAAQSKNGAVAAPKRKVITLDDIRKGYQDELDRLAAIENDQFAFDGGEAMDVL